MSAAGTDPAGVHAAGADPAGAGAAGWATLLAPLAERHAYWMALPDDEVRTDRDEAAGDIRAMQLVLRMERDAPPSWSAAIEAACTAATAVCLDERAAPGGEWHDRVADYVRAHIRKVTRRARGGQWDAVQDLPGITVTHGDAEVRALVPGPVTDLAKRVAKLQVGGTDVPRDRRTVGVVRAQPGGLLLMVPDGVPMTVGKLMAQAGHAGMITAALLAGTDPTALVRWRDAGLPAVVYPIRDDVWRAQVATASDSPGGRRRQVAVRDAGFTEIDPGTVTVVADIEQL